MGHIDRRDAKPFVQALNLSAHLGAQFRIKVGQRFVEQKYLGMAHNGAAHGDTLALSTRQISGAAIQIFGQPKDACDIINRRLNLGLGHFADAQTKRHIVGHIQVWIKRVVLKNHRHIAVFWGNAVHATAINRQLACGDFL